MLRTVGLALGIVLVLAVASILFGTAVPTGSHATPYFSALSSMAVSTAEACPCNRKYCNVVCQPDIDPDSPHACCVQSGHCVSAPCFP